MRLFIAVPIPTGDAFAAATRALVRLAPGAQPVPEGSWHVTLRFFGEIQEREEAASAMAAAVEGISPVPAIVRGVGAFPDCRRARVAWAGVDAPGLADLERRIRQATRRIGKPPERRRFAPHVTLARLRQPVDLQSWIEAYQGIQFFRGRLNHVILFRSDLFTDGPVYTPVSRVVLRENEVPNPT